MVLFPLDVVPPNGADAVQAWEAVAERQHTSAARFLLVRQPHHARVSGNIARAMTAPGLPSLSTDVIRAIEMHDEGWEKYDGLSIGNGHPRSFLDVAPRDFLVAWAASIGIAQEISPIAGYMISSHFRWLAEFRLRTVPDPPEIYEPLDDFASRERLRQEQLLARDGRSVAAAERLVTILQFCDLLSLYLCSGATRPAVFPQAIFENTDLRVRIQSTGGGAFTLTPSPFQKPVNVETQATEYPGLDSSRTLLWTLH